MVQTQLSPRFEPHIDHPLCERCGVPMWLVRIVQTAPEQEKRVFSCAVCELEQAVVIEKR
jgi:hypothetical protein